MGLCWTYCLTTVPARKGTLLPQTLASLAAAGFPEPHLHVDDCPSDLVPWYETTFKLGVTSHWPKLRTYGTWVIALIETFVRNPQADRFAVFQDDFVAVRNMRQYLDKTPYPSKGYWNLYLFPSNESLCPKDENGQKKTGWYESNQMGRGAVGLVFDKATVLTLLGNQACAMYLAERPLSPERGWKAVDGGVVCALQKASWKEYVHYPGLIQHTGTQSSMGNRQHQLCTSFPGENFDALDLLQGKS